MCRVKEPDPEVGESSRCDLPWSIESGQSAWFMARGSNRERFLLVIAGPQINQSSVEYQSEIPATFHTTLIAVRKKQVEGFCAGEGLVVENIVFVCIWPPFWQRLVSWSWGKRTHLVEVQMLFQGSWEDHTGIFMPRALDTLSFLFVCLSSISRCSLAHTLSHSLSLPSFPLSENKHRIMAVVGFGTLSCTTLANRTQVPLILSYFVGATWETRCGFHKWEITVRLHVV